MKRYSLFMIFLFLTACASQHHADIQPITYSFGGDCGKDGSVATCLAKIGDTWNMYQNARITYINIVTDSNFVGNPTHSMLCRFQVFDKPSYGEYLFFDLEGAPNGSNDYKAMTHYTVSLAYDPKHLPSGIIPIPRQPSIYGIDGSYRLSVYTATPINPFSYIGITCSYN